MRRRFLSLVLSGVVGFATALAGAPAAHAAPQLASSWSVGRGAEPDGVSIQIFAGEWGIGKFTITAGPDWAGWETPKKKKWVFTASQSEVSGLENVSGFYGDAWEASSSTDPECQFGGYGVKYTVRQNSCIDTVSRTIFLVMESEAEADAVITSNLDEIVLRSNGSVITAAAGVTTDASFVYDVTDTESLVVDAATTDFVLPQPAGCVDESLVSIGDVADVALTARLDGDLLPTEQSGSDPWVEWDPAFGDTFEIEGDEYYPDAPLENVSAGYSGRIYLPENGTVTLTSTVDLTISGESILEPCPARGSGYNDPLDVSASNGTMNATSTTESLPADMVWSEYTGQQQYAQDGFGGVFTLPLANFDEIGESVVTHFDSSGPSDALDGSGAMTVPTLWDQLRAVRWGADGSNILNVGLLDWDTWEIAATGITSGRIDTISLEQRELDAGCGVTKGLASSIVPIAAPSVDPLVFVNCSKRLPKNQTAEFISVARVSFDDGGSLEFLSNPTPSSPKQMTSTYIQLATNPWATGDEIAVWIYAENANATAKRPTVTNRNVTTVTASGTVSQSTVSGDPFSGDTPDVLSLTAGTTPGSWVGVGEWVGYDEALNDWTIQRHVVTVSGGTTISVGEPVTVPEPDDGRYFGVYAIKAASANSVILGFEGSRYFDGEQYTYFGAGSLNVSTGDVTAGEALSSVISSDFEVPARPVTGFNDSGEFVVYWITSEHEYQVVTWEIP